MEKAQQSRHGREFIEEQLVSLEKRLRTAEVNQRNLGEGKANIRLAEPMQQKLVELEFELAELLQKYTEKHPRVIQVRDQIGSMEMQSKGSSEQELEYARLSREVEVNKKLYGVLKEKLEETRITEAQKVSDVSIVDPAVLPGPSGQVNNNIKILIGALLGLFLGIGLAFILETMDTSIGTIEDVENLIKLPVLGVVPSLESEPSGEKQMLKHIKESIFPTRKTEAEEESFRLIAHFQPHSPITEAYRNIHTNLKLGPNKKTLMITSSSPREGKSSIACNLAIVMGQVGLKTLLVSTDLRRPVIAKTFGIKGEPGLNELMMGTVTLDEVLNNVTDMFLGKLNFEEVRKTPGIENVWILPSGHLPDNPVELLESTRVDNLIEMLKPKFDIIIFDAPPVLPVTDASMLAPKMDCTVLVYEIGRTSREALLRTKIQLEAAGAKISGIVLNHTRAQTEAIADYPYNYRYRKYKYYTKIDPKEEQKEKKKTDKV
jgi:tyrosine-protein kinase Etk/Wzc